MKELQVDLSAPGEVNARMEKPAFLGTGPQGEPGKDGVSVVNLAIEDGHLYCILSSGEIIDAGYFAHNLLMNLNLANQHPISAIQGLQTVLDTKVNNSTLGEYIDAISTSLGTKQNKTDNNLLTTSKQIVGAINELLSGKLDKSAQAAKTDAMTQEVGLDSDGKLWSFPGGGSSDEVWLPSVDASGNISWTKSSSSTPPTQRNIKGATGERGNTISAGGSLPIASGKVNDLFILLTNGAVYQLLPDYIIAGQYMWYPTGYSIKGADGQDGLTTSVTINGETFTQSGGNIDIGMVLRQHQDISGKLNISQGAAHAGEFMVVGADGNITTRSLSTWQGGSY